MNTQYVDINNTRGEAMYKKWQQIIADGIDPFAREHIEKYIGGEIMFETPHWYVFKNDHPYEGVKHQLVIVSQAFCITPEELSDTAWIDLLRVKKEIGTKYGITGGGFTIRFGDTSVSGGTVTHLHAQLIVPEEGKKVAAWFGSEK